MKKTFTNSSQVDSIEYFADDKKMRVVFKTGATYDYFNVPKDVYERAEQAESIGKFINSEIKGKYEYKKA